MYTITKKLIKNPEVLLFLDTETTGVEETDRLIEVAYSIVRPKDYKNIEISYKENLYNTEVPINPAASAVHGYAKWHIKDKPFFKQSKEHKELHILNEQEAIFIAHNSSFDIKMLEKEGLFWNADNVIDTLRVARHLIKDKKVESYSLQYLRYFFEIDLTEEFQELKKNMNITEVRPHTALSDIFILMLFTDFMLKKYNISIQEMLNLSKKPILYESIDFGNIFEKGEKFSKIINTTYQQYGKTKTGLSYLVWAVENMDMLDFDKKFSIKHWLGKHYLEKQNEQLKKYFDYAMFLSFEKEDFNKGLKISNKTKEYYINGLRKKIDLLLNKTMLLDDEKLLLSYIKNIRIKEIENF